MHRRRPIAGYVDAGLLPALYFFYHITLQRCCKIVLFSTFVWRGYHPSAAAMACFLEEPNGPAKERIDLPPTIVTSSAPVGSRIWTGPEMVRTVSCKSLNTEEVVYFWGNTQDKLVRTGIGMGLIYNGVDMGVVKYGSKIQTEIFTNAKTWTTGTIRFQIYLVKTGNTIGSSGPSMIRVFQLDGQRGVNPEWNVNYFLELGALHNLNVSACSVDLFAPTVIDFGPVYWNSSNVVAKQTEFGIHAKKVPLAVVLNALLLTLFSLQLVGGLWRITWH
jgi:hypothetical protein